MAEKKQSHTEFNIENVPQNRGHIKQNPNQNLSINIQVNGNSNGSENSPTLITQDSLTQLSQVKERVEKVYQNGIDQYEELKKKVYLLNQRVIEMEARGRDSMTPIMQITDSNLIQQPTVLQQVGGSQFRKTAANSSLGVKNTRVRALSPVITHKETGNRYLAQGGRMKVQHNATCHLTFPSQLKTPSRDHIVSPVRSPNRRSTHTHFYTRDSN